MLRVARQLVAGLAVATLVACASTPVASVQRKGSLHPPGSAGVQIRTDGTAALNTPDRVETQVLPADETGPQPQVRRGTGQFINRAAAAAPPPGFGATTGEATFNFEGESLQAVVKAILGDMLGQNYVIAPGVQGTVTLATPKPVSPAEAISLLDQVLGWNNARMTYSGGRYTIVPADQALAGTVAPRTGSAANARGFEVRTVPLRYISAEEMKKILEPYARPNAIVGTDSARNVISVGGTRAELQNYLRTIEIFDVDWLSGMSVGVYPLQSGKAPQVVADLEKVFGEGSKSPVAGMFRFMPLEGANAVMVITSQPDYLGDIQQWLERIDNAGGSVQLFSYPLKYIKARDLADRLAEVFGGSGSNGGNADRGAPSLMPGLESAEITSGDSGSSMGFGSQGGSGQGGGEGELSLGAKQSGNASVALEVEGDKVGVSAVEETNALLVRSSPQAWKSIKDVIVQLDVMPMQVHIEAQVVEVQLSGALEYGVNWFFENAVTDNGLPDAVGRDTWSTLSGSVGQAVGNPGGVAWTFLGRNAAAVIKALDSVTDVNMLQTPSVVVRNNAEATFNVGSRIPVSSVTVNPGLGNDTSYSQVQYLDTGVILKVRPRVSKDGMVFLEIVQEVSAPGGDEDRFGNVRIDTRKLKTEAAIQSGDTVMLAGLIRDSVVRGSKGFPGLNRIPVIGGLFGTQTSATRREETIVLLTPTIVRNPQDARDLTDEYGRRFRALEPLHRPSKP
ncbi:general secretion pathway protein GspD [Lysobacter concretionis Ko07 = DSM 16239]|uniref:General secretion pathway protein GspD n=1 Tax=Lysobacter concretionis Ko07 = DSM 16239 TaxID=1122185 RepID=A0A0A0ER99_9GAMM|nr:MULTISPECIES: type II secretion system secretin GspD [Lysobacter]KGM52984.1 general secretion pathway protein GspD [Lysobacter concretionis Ko07 = DSM 16239]QOD91421.1 type II secretion system secretin GspD [Lysobacter sp. CW239]